MDHYFQSANELSRYLSLNICVCNHLSYVGRGSQRWEFVVARFVVALFVVRCYASDVCVDGGGLRSLCLFAC